jgi:hypothetical protein
LLPEPVHFKLLTLGVGVLLSQSILHDLNVVELLGQNSLQVTVFLSEVLALPFKRFEVVKSSSPVNERR